MYIKSIKFRIQFSINAVQEKSRNVYCMIVKYMGIGILKTALFLWGVNCVMSIKFRCCCLLWGKIQYKRSACNVVHRPLSLMKIGT